MANPELEDACYLPTGIPVTPQARRIGYTFPVYVSHTVFAKACKWDGHSRFQTNFDKRINELIVHAYDGMIKRLATSDDFVFYKFKCWFWDRYASRDAKKKRMDKFGARLFLDKDGSPWMYIFDLKKDRIENLEKGKFE